VHLTLHLSLRDLAQHQVSRAYELRSNLLVFSPSSFFLVGRQICLGLQAYLLDVLDRSLEVFVAGRDVPPGSHAQLLGLHGFLAIKQLER
jgi:hypothetical protein